MSRYHRTTRTDKNQVAIFAHLRDHGFEVTHIAGGTLPDALVCYAGGFYALMEIKAERGAGAKFTRIQLDWMSKTKGLVGIVRDCDAALRFARNPHRYALTQKQKDALAGFLLREPAAKKFFTVQQIDKILES